MNATLPRINMQAHTIHKTGTSVSPQPHLINVSLSDIDPDLVRMKSICAVLTAYNDEAFIGSVVIRVKQYVDRVFVVDDGSSDHTGEIAQLAGAEVIRLDQPTGKTYALLLGLRRARETRCCVTVVLDGDGKHDPRDIHKFAGLIREGKADLVIGSCFLDKKENFPLKQKIKQVMLQLPTDTPQHLIPTNPLSGFIAFSMRGLDHIDFPFEKTRFHQTLIKHFLSKDLQIKEVAITKYHLDIAKCGWDYSATVIAALPAYNEETYLSKIIPILRMYVDIVIVVDDGSTDATHFIAEQLGAYVIRHTENRGYGGALQTIFSAARDLDADALVIMDSDGQHNPKDIPSVLEPLLKGADVVIGSRFLDKTENTIPAYRKFGMKVLDIATSASGVEKGIDTQSGFRAYGKKAIKVLNISGNGMSAGSEILMQLRDNNLTIKEVPVNVRYDIENTSTQNPVSHGFMALYKIIGLISYRRPLPTFGIPGLGLLIIGLILGFLAIKDYAAFSRFPFVLTMVGGVFIMTGLLLIIAALILNYLVVFVSEQKTTKGFQ